MSGYAPSICPECGSSRVGKEYINGVKTDDWVCKDCEACGQLRDEPWPTGLIRKYKDDEK